MARLLKRMREMPWVSAALLGATTLAAVIVIWRLGLFQTGELWFYDLLVRNHDHADSETSPVVLVVIEEEDIRRYGWALSDGLLSRALELLTTRYAPRVVGFDIYRDLPDPRSGEQVGELNATLLRHTNIVAIRMIGNVKQKGIPGPPVLEGLPGRVGFNDFPLDEHIDNRVRRGLLYLQVQDEDTESFALLLAISYLRQSGVEPKVRDGHLHLGKSVLPPLAPNDGCYVNVEDVGYQVLLDYPIRGTPQAFSLSDLFTNGIPSEALKDCIVILGVRAESVKDGLSTPISASHAGIEIHAQFVDQLVRDALTGSSPLRFWSEWQEALWLLLWGLLGLAVGTQARSFPVFGAANLIGVVALGSIGWKAFEHHWWIPAFAPASAFVPAAGLMSVLRYFQTRRERRTLMTLFAKHVSPEIASAIWEERSALMDGQRLRPRKLVVTILFSDLKGFTTVSEAKGPEFMIQWLNEYMEAMSAEILRRKGVINEYVGDAIMATFGIPFGSETEEEIATDARHAVESALAMAEKMDELNGRWQAEGRPPTAMRVGIYTGPVITGSVGSRERLKYALVGDTVNTAARLESFDKELNDPASPHPNCRILIGEPTWRRVSDRFEGKCAGSFALKGKQEKVIIYQVFRRHAPS
jgi:CHASE2 domain-containing sensor protein/class 3 adenylate cyclase